MGLWAYLVAGLIVGGLVWVVRNGPGYPRLATLLVFGLVGGAIGGLGANIAHVFPTAPVAPIILLGMVSYFAGVVQAPITAFVIVTEMTDNHAMVIPLMCAALIGYGASKIVCPEGIYHALAKGFAHPKAPVTAN